MWHGTPHCGLQYLTCCVANQHVKYHYNHPHAATLQFFSLHLLQKYLVKQKDKERKQYNSLFFIFFLHFIDQTII